MAKTQTVSSLAPNPKNPRKITKKKLSALQVSMEKYGDLGGIIYNRTTERLVGGHQRKEAFAAMDANTVTIEREYESPTRTGTIAEGFVDLNGERFSYREVAWPADLEAAANIQANKSAGDWEMPKLQEMMSELDDAGFDLDLTGFDVDERMSLASDAEHVPTRENTPEEEIIVEVPDDSKTKIGDTYMLGRHRLRCGDSNDVQHLDALMQSTSMDMVFTDPPYGMNLETDRSSVRNTNPNIPMTVGRVWRPVIGDDEDFNPGFLLSYFAGCKEIFLWGADYYGVHLPKDGSWVVWDKRVLDSGEPIHEFHGSHFELCWSKQKHQRLVCRWLWLGIKQKGHEGERFHPTQKPYGMVQWFLDKWCKENGKVVDLYGGSGSTLLACEKSQRQCFMMEIDPRYCDVIIARWEKLTGQKAELLPREE